MDSILSTAAHKHSVPLVLDHLVVAARTLDEGEAWLEARLHRDLVAGGAHLGFGTHNRLLRLGDDCYLELIAPDPAQQTPQQLFGLEQATVARALADEPVLLHMVFRVVAPATLADVLPRLDYDPGVPTAMSRGELSWQITIPPGQLAGEGLLPTVIDWGDTRHPCTRLPDSGVALAALRLQGPAAVVEAFPRPAEQGRIQPTLAVGSQPAIRAEFVVDGTTIIIESCLPHRNLASFA
jgi:Glyoxalase-like domain